MRSSTMRGRSPRAPLAAYHATGNRRATASRSICGPSRSSTRSFAAVAPARKIARNVTSRQDDCRAGKPPPRRSQRRRSGAPAPKEAARAAARNRPQRPPRRRPRASGFRRAPAARCSKLSRKRRRCRLTRHRSRRRHDARSGPRNALRRRACGLVARREIAAGLAHASGPPSPDAHPGVVALPVFSVLEKVSRRPTVRMKTGLPGSESRSRRNSPAARTASAPRRWMPRPRAQASRRKALRANSG